LFGFYTKITRNFRAFIKKQQLEIFKYFFLNMGITGLHNFVTACNYIVKIHVKFVESMYCTVTTL
jgi:hypothetical protein